tara:strand:+ start:180 stop:422 length:243 start_codon:yes stop_codon:yes gene_type:complete
MQTLEMIPKAGNLGVQQNLTMSDQRHLWWQVIALKKLNVVPMVTKTDVIGTAIITGTQKPEGVHNKPLQWQHSGDRIAGP